MTLLVVTVAVGRVRLGGGEGQGQQAEQHQLRDGGQTHQRKERIDTDLHTAGVTSLQDEILS